MKVNGHDFPAGVPKAIPYGVYDVGADAGFVSVGVDHDTAPFAVNAVRTWWQRVGRVRYPHARRLMLTADGGRLQRPPAAGVEGRAGQAGC